MNLLSKGNTKRALAAALALWLPTSFSPAANAAPGLQCDAQVCTLDVGAGVKFEAGVNATMDSGAAIELSGDVVVHAGATNFILSDAVLVFEPRTDHPTLKFELYGVARAPIGDIELFKGANIGITPRAAVGLVSRDTLKDLLDDEGDPLPLAENYTLDEEGNPQLIEPAYLFFHYATGLSWKLPLAKWLQFDESAEDPFDFSLPFDKSVTFILDPADPYFYLSSDARELVVDETNAQIERAQLYKAAYDEQEAERKAEEERQQQADNGNGTDSNDPNTNDPNTNDPKNDPSDEDKKDGDSALPDLGGLAFSWSGGIPFAPQTVWGLPADVGQFHGHLMVETTIPLYKFVEIDGTIVTHISDKGFEQGGNGDVNVVFEIIPNLLSFSFPLGNASAGVKITDDQFATYFSGISQPDFSFLPPIIPMVPDNTTQVAGYIDTDNPANTRLEAYGKFTYDMSGFTQLTGIALGQMPMSEAHMVIDANGVRATGRTSANILPNVDFGGSATVDIYFSPTQPLASYIKIEGEISVLGVGLTPATVSIGGNGVFINGTFVTPLSTIAVAGQFTDKGPALSGSAGVNFPLGDIMSAINDARKDVIAAQATVDSWSVAVDHMRGVVNAERAESQKKLTVAQAGVTAAQSQVNSLNSSIRYHDGKIAAARRAISSKYSWYKRQKWYNKSWAWGKYTAYRAYQNGRIAYHNTAKAGVIVARTAATAALNVAKEALKVAQAGIAVIPVDADPRVAGLIVSLEAAKQALVLAELALPPMPEITADIKGDINLSIDYKGVSGTVNASFNGTNITDGQLKLGANPQACINILPLGDLCVAI
ncbi:MAG: hypothetical protein K0U93_08250 [Gammaproteobacteria bacterium]|nr:hypothetical protein [Gammaproteobacteria bacterium]